MSYEIATPGEAGLAMTYLRFSDFLGDRQHSHDEMAGVKLNAEH